MVAHDLKSWQEKFAKAADEGSDELEDRITEITDRLVQNQAQGVGKALTIQLEEAVKSRLSTLKSSIISIVKAADGEASEESEEALSTAVRKAGVAIKEKAQDVRTWRQSYDRETNSLVSKAAQDTFEIIDLIRDSGLQEIGMRWAWTDGITHKDWTKYHQLKTTFDEWRLDVEKVATEHPGLEKARAASEEVESKAMEIAENAAKELARLKETGRWKLSAGDASDDFSTKLMPHVVAAADQKIIKKVSEAVGGNSQGTMESVASVASSFLAGAVSSASSIAASQAEKVQNIASDASKSASTAASPISSSVIGTSQGSVESVISVGSASASSLSDKASSSIIGTQQRSAESVASVKASASSIVDQASSSVIGTPQGSDESIVSVSSESASSLSAKASSSVIGTVPGVGEKASSSIKSSASVLSKSASSLSDAVSTSISSGSSQASKGASNASKLIKSASSSVSSSVSKSASDASSSISSAASSTSSTASKKVWSGAMAQFVEARQIVYEDIVDDSDDETFSEKLASMAREAGDRYSDITKAVSEAFLKPTSTGGPTVTKLAMEKYSSAISAASVALYGTEQGTGESVASSRYFDAVSA